MLLMNLLTNAIKYNESKVPRVDIAFERQNRKLLISFKDNGIGLEKGKIKKSQASGSIYFILRFGAYFSKWSLATPTVLKRISR